METGGKQPVDAQRVPPMHYLCCCLAALAALWFSSSGLPAPGQGHEKGASGCGLKLSLCS